MAQQYGMTADMDVLTSGLAEKEFTIARRGYEPGEVQAFLSEVEFSFREFEAWAEKMKARLAIAEDKAAAIDDVQQAMAAVFETKARVLENAERRARRIEATAVKRGRADAEALSAELVGEARRESERIIKAALAVATRTSEESILSAARVEADRLIREARIEADRLIERARSADDEQATKPDMPWTDGNVTASSQSVPPVTEPELVIDLDGASGGAAPEPAEAPPVERHEAPDRLNEDRRSRYERTSAGLPSMGDDGAEIFDAIRRMRKGLANR